MVIYIKKGTSDIEYDISVKDWRELKKELKKTNEPVDKNDFHLIYIPQRGVFHADSTGKNKLTLAKVISKRLIRAYA